MLAYDLPFRQKKKQALTGKIVVCWSRQVSTFRIIPVSSTFSTKKVLNALENLKKQSTLTAMSRSTLTPSWPSAH
jgi:hypothetical protein